jgi:hypothetical protein
MVGSDPARFSDSGRLRRHSVWNDGRWPCVKSFSVIMFLPLLLSACLSTQRPINLHELCSHNFPFIQDLSATKPEITVRLSANDNARLVYGSNDGRILIYRIGDPADATTAYNLVLAFDASEVLSDHSLLKMP